MNRIRFGAALLAVLLISGILVARNMSSRTEEIAGQLDTAARQALEGELPAAVETARQAEKNWQARWAIHAAVADHDPMEQVDAGFAQLQIYGESGEGFSFAALCAGLAQQIRAIGEAGSASWRNIL